MSQAKQKVFKFTVEVCPELFLFTSYSWDDDRKTDIGSKTNVNSTNIIYVNTEVTPEFHGLEAVSSNLGGQH